jgi:8-oxo-dGTP diphosphatase
MENFPTTIAVVAAALIAPDGLVLLQQRPAHKHHGGLWEFPGGKVEPGEAPKSALVRELAEELAIGVDPSDLVFCAQAGAADHGLVISLYTCRRWHGEMRNLDAAALRWVLPGEVTALPLPPLDVPLAQALAAAI